MELMKILYRLNSQLMTKINFHTFALHFKID